MSWDEPLFYDYADSIRIAYTPKVFDPKFDFYQVFGKSPEDHKIYGPAYLLIARPFQQLTEAIFDTDMASAWHLVNFTTFQLGLLIFYFLCRRWFAHWPAAASTAFLAWQPVYWGHAFINPKDIPFMVLFLASLASGLEFVDKLESIRKKPWGWLILAAITLGLTSATRVIGPLAGVIIFFYFILKKQLKSIHVFLLYGLIASLIMYIFWPYLWADPINRLIEVFKHMSNNPTELSVLFDGQIFRANAMPRRYLPQMLGMTLTEPTWFLIIIGGIVYFQYFLRKKVDWRAPLALSCVTILMLTYVLYFKPSVYDGFRHFFFITPPLFLLIGFGFQWLWEKMSQWKWIALISVLLLPGLFGIIHLYPYEYAYYNFFSGGIGNAYRTYETDFWLTCYKEAVGWIEENSPDSTLHIQREFMLANYYNNGLAFKDLSKETELDIKPGDLILFHTRGNLDIRSNYRKLPAKYVIGRDSAEFCIIKQKD